MRFQTLLCAIAFSLCSSACTKSDSPLVILQNQVPEVGCLVTNSPTDTFFARGIIDTESTTGYRFFPVIQNNAAEIDGATGQRVAQIQGVDIKITLQPGLFSAASPFAGDTIDPPPRLSDFTLRFSGSIQPGGSTASFDMVVLSKELLDAIGPRLSNSDQRTFAMVELNVFGLMGGNDIEAQPFVYFIDICKGCMKIDVGSCAGLATDFTARNGGPCNQLQDVPTDCCDVGSETEQCPAKPAGAN